jgi:hypothetical protein
MKPTDDQLAVLACDITLRPKDAPGIADIAAAVRSLDREPGALVLEFDPAARAVVAQLVEAERRCCAGIGWDLHLEPAPRLRITATAEQLDIIEQAVSI